MARHAALIFSLALASLLPAAAGAAAPDKLKTPQTRWEKLSPDERRVLGPVAPDWERMPGYQQQRLITRQAGTHRMPVCSRILQHHIHTP